MSHRQGPVQCNRLPILALHAHGVHAIIAVLKLNHCICSIPHLQTTTRLFLHQKIHSMDTPSARQHSASQLVTIVACLMPGIWQAMSRRSPLLCYQTVSCIEDYEHLAAVGCRQHALAISGGVISSFTSAASHRAVVVDIKVLQRLHQAARHVARLCRLHSRVHQTLAPSHRVEEELVRLQPREEAVGDEALARGRLVPAREVRQGSILQASTTKRHALPKGQQLPTKRTSEPGAFQKESGRAKI